MKTNQEPIILSERAADQGRIRAVLREWGYRESEIPRFLKELRKDKKFDEQSKRTDQLNKTFYGHAQ